jgi:hypothetical protein
MNNDELRQTRINNLKLAQASRKENSRERVNQAIKQLEKRKQKINFQTVAQEANVSVAYLYKYPEIKQRIAEIRKTQSSIPRQDFQSASEVSQTKIQSRLQERIHKLELENRELRRKNEALAGQVYRVHQLQEQVERQNYNIQDLEKQLKECKLLNSRPSKVTHIKKKFYNDNSIDDKQIKSEISALNIQMNSTLSKLIKRTKKEVVLNAIDCLKEALTTTQVNNLAGFLVEAIKNSWSKNEIDSRNVEPEIFYQWFSFAKSQGLVVTSRFIEGILYVCTPDGELISFDEMLSKYSLEELKLRTM